MPAAIEKLASEQLEAHVLALGLQVRQRRKVLGVSVVTAAQSAGMSRDTWHRIKKGEVTVTIGAWFSALTALGLEFGVGIAGEPHRARAAFDIYERNERHIDQDNLTLEEAELMDGLRRVFGDSSPA